MGTLTVLISLVLFATVSAGLRIIRAAYSAEDLPGLDECGFEKVKRIFGGNETRAGEYPWLAALEYNKEDTRESAGIKCGGSVLNTRYILTAGHCLFPPDHELVQVWLGLWKISTAETTDKDKVIKFGIEEKFLHDDYADPTTGNDIGLLRLDADITYTDYIRPTCLPTQDLDLPPYGTRLVVAGWGSTENGPKSDIKLKVDVPVVQNSVCENHYDISMTGSQMCAGTEDGKDSCVGDSGGPLMIKFIDPNTDIVHWVPHGIVSFGDDPCGLDGVGSVYTRVSKFIIWIKSKLKS